MFANIGGMAEMTTEEELYNFGYRNGLSDGTRSGKEEGFELGFVCGILSTIIVVGIAFIVIAVMALLSQ